MVYFGSTVQLTSSYLCGNSYVYILLYELMVLLKFANIATECFNLIKSTEEIHRPISLWNIPFLE